MGTQSKSGTETAPPRQRSWRDDLVADYEISQARLQVAIEFSEDTEEYL